MIYISAAALGFAGGENFFYIVRAYVGGLEDASARTAFAFAFGNVAIFRALFLTIGHVTWSGITGYFLGQHLIGKRSGRVLLWGIILATLMHTAWNLTWFLQQAFAGDVRTFWFISLTWYFVIAMLIAAFGIGLYLLLLRRSLAASPFRVKQLAAAPAGPPAGETPPAG